MAKQFCYNRYLTQLSYFLHSCCWNMRFLVSFEMTAVVTFLDGTLNWQFAFNYQMVFLTNKNPLCLQINSIFIIELLSEGFFQLVSIFDQFTFLSSKENNKLFIIRAFQEVYKPSCRKQKMAIQGIVCIYLLKIFKRHYYHLIRLENII